MDQNLQPQQSNDLESMLTVFVAYIPTTINIIDCEDCNTPRAIFANEGNFTVELCPNCGNGEYLINSNVKFNYFGNGEGKHRIWKTREAAEGQLEQMLDPEVYLDVIIHPIQLKIAVPMPEEAAPSQLPKTFNNIPITPITTLAPPSFPTAQELLDDHLIRRNQAKKRFDGKSN